MAISRAVYHKIHLYENLHHLDPSSNSQLASALPPPPAPRRAVLFKPDRVPFLLLRLPLLLRKQIPSAGLGVLWSMAPLTHRPQPTFTPDAPRLGHTGSCQLLLVLKRYPPTSVGTCVLPAGISLCPSLCPLCAVGAPQAACRKPSLMTELPRG